MGKLRMKLFIDKIVVIPLTTEIVTQVVKER